MLAQQDSNLRRFVTIIDGDGVLRHFIVINSIIQDRNLFSLTSSQFLDINWARLPTAYSL